MNELTQPLSEDDRFQLKLMIEKLFLLQDRPIPEKKNAIFVNELADSGKPFQAILSAIHSLQAQDLKQIKISTILDEIDSFMEPGQSEQARCDECSGSGLILMKDGGGAVFSLACTCPHGWRYRKSKEKLVFWNGQDSQHSRGRTLSRY